MHLGLYIHVPFCRARCHFCAFYLRIFQDETARDYLTALSQEIRLHAERDSLGGRHLDTVYFGGGTPTTLTSPQLCGILDHVRESFGMAPDAEVTIEAHPDTLNAEGLKDLVRAGFTRLSVGVQSLDEQDLVSIGRRTKEKVPWAAIHDARHAGFSNINLDLMYGLPGQTMEGWDATLKETLALQPTHVSCYALTVEAKTTLDRDIHTGALGNPDPDLQVAMDELAANRLREAGYDRYEVSNYARPGYACRHNLLYWQGEEYLGLGPSAQSYLGGCRIGNIEKLGGYTRRLLDGHLPIVEKEPLSDTQARREQIVFGLRLIQGIDRGVIQQVPDPIWQRTFDNLLRTGLLEAHGERVRMTDWGRRYADSIAVELL